MTSFPDVARSGRHARHAAMLRAIGDNAGLLWRVLHRRFPRGEADPRVRHVGTMEDLYSEVALATALHGHTYDPRKGALSTWLTNTAWYVSERITATTGLIRLPPNIPAEHNRRSAERARRPGPLRRLRLLSREAPPDNALADADEHANLWRAVDGLPQPAPLVLRLYFVDGLLQQDIGRKLSLSRQRINQIIVRACAALREQLECRS